MHILVITPHYPPDGGPSAPLFGMLCEEISRSGYDVTVITAVPHYPTGYVQTVYNNVWQQRSIENQVEVVRVWVPSVDRSNLVRRLLQFIAYQIGSTLAGIRLHYDVLLITNPALITILPFAVLARIRRKPVVFSVYDVYPEVGIELGIFRHRIVKQIVTLLERFCLLNAQCVHVLTSSFIPPLRELGVDEDIISVISVWIDTDFVRPLPRKNPFSDEFGLNDDFVVLYAGNIGLPQGLENVLYAAQVVNNHPKIKFVFVGEGAGRERLQAMAENMNLKNVSFISWQSLERVPNILAAADITLVSLQSQVSGRALPSKTISYLASGRPIIAVVDEGSDTWNLVERAKAGVCVSPGDPQKLAKAVLMLQASADMRESMARAGRAYAEQHHSYHQAAQQFIALLERAKAQMS